MSDWQFWMDVIQAVGSVASVVLTAIISFLIWRYTNKKDKLDILITRWNQQQTVNIQTLSSEADLIAIEKLIYGQDHKVDVEVARMYTYLFIFLNFLQMKWLAKEQGIISKKEFESNSIPTLSLISNNRELVSYLLKERGYPVEFRLAIEELLPKTSPPKPTSSHELA